MILSEVDVTFSEVGMTFSKVGLILSGDHMTFSEDRMIYVVHIPFLVALVEGVEQKHSCSEAQIVDCNQILAVDNQT
jgi:hypothetical protein